MLYHVHPNELKKHAAIAHNEIMSGWKSTCWKKWCICNLHGKSIPHCKKYLHLNVPMKKVLIFCEEKKSTFWILLASSKWLKICISISICSNQLRHFHVFLLFGCYIPRTAHKLPKYSQVTCWSLKTWWFFLASQDFHLLLWEIRVSILDSNLESETSICKCTALRSKDISPEVNDVFFSDII